MSFWEGARLLIAQGEPESALDALESFFRGRLNGPLRTRAREMLDIVLLLRAQGVRLAREQMQGVTSQRDAEIRRSQRDKRILDLLGEVERLDQLHPPIVSIELPDDIQKEHLLSGESQLRSTGWLAGGLKRSAAVCRLSNGSILGSGFRCLHAAVITNNHVISGPSVAKMFRAEFFFEEDETRRLREPIRAALDPDKLFWTSEKLDVTLVGLESVPDQTIGLIQLSQGVSAVVGDRVSIIQHPSGGPKQIAVTNNRILSLEEPFVYYMTDTLPGSSGSPVFVDSWKVLAVHRAGGNAKKTFTRRRIVWKSRRVGLGAFCGRLLP